MVVDEDEEDAEAEAELLSQEQRARSSAPATPAPMPGLEEDTVPVLDDARYALLLSADLLKADKCYRTALFRQKVARAFSGPFATADEVTRETLLPEINAGLPTEEMFGSQEADRILTMMNDANDVMFSEGVVYKL